MKRLVFLLSAPLLLVGCAQVFDGNLFSSVDKAPKVSVSSSASVSEIQGKMADASFYQSLKSDSTALSNTQTALKNAYTAATTPAAKVDAATTAIIVTAKATEVGPLVTQVANSLPTIKDSLAKKDALGQSAPDYNAVMKDFLGDKKNDAAYIASTLTQLATMNDAFKAMQTASTANGAVDKTTFFASTTGDSAPVDKVGLAQLALLSAAAAAITADGGGIAATAAALASGGSITTGTQLDLLAAAQKGSVDPATNPYAYFNTAQSTIPGL